MTTYNHEKFVAQALDGILMQEVDFPYEIVLGEDCSTDRTREIVCEYQRRHPDKIRLRLARENLYSQKLKPGIGVLHACRGKYIAMCEGDDYWTDPQKLQRQAWYLEAHPECALVCGVARVVREASGRGPPEHGSLQPFPFPPAETTIRDLARFGGYIMTCTSMHRNWLEGEGLPDWLRSCPIGDWPLNLLAALRGSIYFDERVVAAYRVHPGGVWSRQTSVSGAYAVWTTSRIISHAPELAEICESVPDLADEWNRRMIRNLKGELAGLVAQGGRFGPLLRDLLRREAPEFRLTRAERQTLSLAVFEDAFYSLSRSLRHREAFRMALRILFHHPAWWLRRDSLGVVRQAAAQALRSDRQA